jgi:hypothetical protein
MLLGWFQIREAIAKVILPREALQYTYTEFVISSCKVVMIEAYTVIDALEVHVAVDDPVTKIPIGEGQYRNRQYILAFFDLDH